MLGDGLFFSPLQTRPRHTQRRPWGNVQQADEDEDTPNGRPQLSISMPTWRSDPDLASGSCSSSSQESLRRNNENGPRRRPSRAEPVQEQVAENIPRSAAPWRDGRTAPRQRPSSSAATVCRICLSIAILALLGIVLVVRLVHHGRQGASFAEVEPTHETPPDLAHLPDIPLMERSLPGEVAAEAPSKSTKAASQSLEEDVQPNVRDTVEREIIEAVLPLGGLAAILRDATESRLLTTGRPPTPETGQEEAPCWIFMHMEKSGSSLVRSIATERWRRDERMFDNVQWHRGDAYAVDVMGHFHWRLLHGGCVEALRNVDADEPPASRSTGGRGCRWFTVFRHPVARLISAFDHCRQASRDPLCASATVTDLEDFSEDWGNFGLTQFAMATASSDAVKEWATSLGKPRKGVSAWHLFKEYLSHGPGGGAEDGAILESVLETAKQIISTQYAAVGIAEDLSTTMRLFNKALLMPHLDWSTSLERRSANANEEAYDTIEDKAFREALTNPRILGALEMDILLYEHAASVFREQVVRYGLL